jgi:anti-sigma28 factor (negative regulator of flagellin synthesis)
LSEQLIAKATRTDQIMSEDEREIEDSTNGEQTSDGESEINDKNDDVKTIREKDSSKSDPSDNKNSVNPEKVHELKAKLVDNNCALTDVTESELVTLLSITG